MKSERSDEDWSVAYSWYIYHVVAASMPAIHGDPTAIADDRMLQVDRVVGGAMQR